jgi:hypothetical protein
VRNFFFGIRFEYRRVSSEVIFDGALRLCRGPEYVSLVKGEAVNIKICRIYCGLKFLDTKLQHSKVQILHICSLER